MITTTTLITAFTLGLLGNLHCLGMCGGLIGLMGQAQQGQALSLRSPVIWMTVGRLSMYSLLGAMFGGFGHLLSWQFGAWLGMTLRALAALLLIAMGLYLTQTWLGLSRLEALGAKLWQRISPYAKKLMPINSPGKALAFGGLWGLLPCGLIYSALAWAAVSQSAVVGAAIMGFFGLGTLPAVLGVGGVIAQAKHWGSWIGIGVIALGSWSLYQVLAAGLAVSWGAICHVLSS